MFFRGPFSGKTEQTLLLAYTSGHPDHTPEQCRLNKESPVAKGTGDMKAAGCFDANHAPADKAEMVAGKN